MHKILYAVFCLVTSVANFTTSQAQTRPAYGVFGNYNLNSFNADFRSFPGVPSCCPLYQDGTGTGVSVGGLFEIPLSDAFRLALRAGYSSRSGSMSRTENTTVAGNLPGVFEHQVDASIADLGVEPLAQYNPFASLWLNLGGRVAFVSTKQFSQKETVVSPTNGIFSSGSSRRNVVTDQAIPDGSSLFAALIGGVSYDLPINSKKTLILAPEALYSFGLTPVVSGLSWNSNSLRLGIALKYSPLPSKDPIQRIEKKQSIDTVRKEAVIASATFVRGVESTTSTTQESGDEILTTETTRRTDTLLIPQKAVAETPSVPTTIPTTKQVALSATVSASGVEADGTETATVKLEVEEFASVLMTPLLNYIFFDDNSATLPAKYKQLDEKGIERFREERVNNPNRLSTYYQILNIIGKRMRLNPDAIVTLVGCNSDIGAEKGNTALSKQRAEVVKEYIVNKWNVPESQFKIESRNLPLKSANSQTSDGVEENRRVEILSSNSAIIAPIITNDTLRTVSPPSVRFRSNVLHDNPLSKWSLTAEQDGRILKKFDGMGDVPKVLDWNIDEEKGTHPRSESGVNYTLNITDSENKTVTSSNVIPVEQTTIRRKRTERRGDKEINRYSLILFDVRSTEITPANQQVINLIKQNITGTSTVKITGYTDRTGDAKANQSLAEGRAKATASALGIPDNPLTITGKGNASTYNAETPEGRLYTRTVDVVVETQVKE